MQTALWFTKGCCVIRITSLILVSFLQNMKNQFIHGCLLQKVLYLAVWPKEVLLCPEMMLHHFCFFFNARKVVLMYFVTM